MTRAKRRGFWSAQVERAVGAEAQQGRSERSRRACITILEPSCQFLCWISEAPPRCRVPRGEPGLLLARGRARAHRWVPCVIRLTDRVTQTCALSPLRVQLDTGSTTTGLAVVRDVEVVTAESGATGTDQTIAGRQI